VEVKAGMSTVIIKISPSSPEAEKIAAAARVIRAGGLVAFPTETVYGLGADAFNEKAIGRIYAVKGRPADNPLIVHLDDFDQVSQVAASFPSPAQTLCSRFWPGPLTVILPCLPALPGIVSAGLQTVAVRIPAHNIARALIRAAGTPIVAPSANLSGRPSPTRAAHVREDLAGLIEMIIDGGKTRIGMESTVLDFTAPHPVILRPGGITARAIEAVIGPVGLAFPAEADTKPKAPGMKYRHYSPRTPLILAPEENFRAWIQERVGQEAGRKVAVITFHPGPAYEGCLCLDGGLAPRTAAHRLFAIFRDLDQAGMDLIIAEPYPAGKGLALMVNDRLQKAAGRHHEG
jgi:L-threonylcarbamoyladenylate synthase